MATVRETVRSPLFQRAIRTAAVGGDDHAVLRAASEALHTAGLRVTIPSNLRQLVEAGVDLESIPDALASADIQLFTDGAYGLLQKPSEKVALAGNDPMELLVDVERKTIKLVEGAVNHILALYERDPKTTLSALQQLSREHDHAQVSPTDHWLRDVKATVVRELLKRCKSAIKDDGRSVRREAAVVEAGTAPLPLSLDFDIDEGEFEVRVATKVGDSTRYDSVSDLLDHVRGWAKSALRRAKR